MMKYNTQLKSYRKWLMQINDRRCGLESASDQQLKKISSQLIKQAREGAALDNLMVEAFSLACEVSRRVLNMRPFDVQVAAGIALHRGNLVQMETGEGKTLAAVLPAYLNALTGKGVHVLTFNDYLARRDAQWMGPVYRFLGLSVAFVREGMSIKDRQEAYAADITYVTAKEAGFDFLRDRRCYREEDQVLRDFHFAIVDEADSILIDEARIPLVIAGESEDLGIDFYKLAKLIRGLDPHVDFYTDEYGRDVNFTDTGLEKVEKYLGRGDLHQPENNQVLSAVNLALQAEVLLKRDIDYIVREGRIELVDEFTGRVADNRRWPYGLQTAIEAKEGVEIQPEGIILGSITFQHFLNLYPKIAGMTATAKTSGEEFQTFYGLKVVEIPPNRPCIRIDHEDVVFTHKEAKRKALIREIRQVHAAGRPILVGTVSVEESEQLAQALRQTGIRCQVLNAKNDEVEAAIVAEAGALRAVTISTNMAGRGTDIRLGGKNQETHDQVVALGGLYVIGTNRHESRRIDHQLRGRAGRQGDPGSSRFFISLEDDLMVRYRVTELIPPKHLPQKQEEPIRSPVVAREIARAQRIIEGQNFEIRKTLKNYSYLIEEQRKIMHHIRDEAMLSTKENPLTLLADYASERYHQLLPHVGKETLTDVERRITLFYIDQCWTEHLAYIAHVREGIHLWAWGGKVPYFEFQKIAVRAFDDLLQRHREKVIETFNRAAITKNGIDMAHEGLTGPSSTWTYLINDMPFDNPLQSVLVGSSAFASMAPLAMLPYLPFILIGRLIRRFFKRKKK
ncbi:MAG: accessory Sec system translocase SecA2 [Candidatus Aminicenantes bacterium]|nr:accessory Sec system translocase SecA2 [Candidatus Aminicenantes bacterium]NIM78811.1 accessory Sec system translocase SecA2 [Candidatus Aminicenantes bacterium]NIN18066.1 accessory Sec system translocase SecA2 [Candidatus Aminicenantes bacterium]NIN41965.1 accessory Sec system translocase SecA2 [Candidatus Aminicenantes bacterium]NIN84721.1 accessory Sec system translocase SecA2 [Candidatus Aminicenantes bacterium]